MPLKSLRAWLGVETLEKQNPPAKQKFAPLRETLDALDHLEPDRARYLAALRICLGGSPMPTSMYRRKKPAPWKRSCGSRSICPRTRR